MRLAEVDMKTIITERAGHIQDYLLNTSLDDIEVYFNNYIRQAPVYSVDA